MHAASDRLEVRLRPEEKIIRARAAQLEGAWGVGEGWFLMLPLLGPSTNRDLVGGVADNWTQILRYVDGVDFWDRMAVMGAAMIDRRAQLLDADDLLEQQIDPYIFVRTAYLQRRWNLVYDGNPPEPEFEFPDE